MIENELNQRDENNKKARKILFKWDIIYYTHKQMNQLRNGLVKMRLNPKRVIIW